MTECRSRHRHRQALTVLAAPPAVVGEVAQQKQPDLVKSGNTLLSARISQPTAIGLMPTPPTVPPFGWLGATVLLALAGVSLNWLRRHRDKVVLALGGALRAEDSDRFMRALKIWNPVVVSYDPTPRHVKRFYNRARLFAAYEQQANAADAARDESLVALAAMHHLDPASLGELENALASAEHEGRAPTGEIEAWLERRDFGAGFNEASGDTPTDPSAAARSAALHKAWKEHLAAFESVPSASQVRRFASRVEGILVR